METDDRRGAGLYVMPAWRSTAGGHLRWLGIAKRGQTKERTMRILRDLRVFAPDSTAHHRNRPYHLIGRNRVANILTHSAGLIRPTQGLSSVMSHN